MKYQRKLSFSKQGKNFVKEKEKELIIYKEPIKALKKLIHKKKKKVKIKILDLGCGYGRISKVLKKFGNVVGLDISYQGLKLAKKLKIPLVLGDGEILPFRSKSFDVVVCAEVIPYTDNPYNMLREIKRVLVNNGLLFLSVENLYGGLISDPFIKASEIEDIIRRGESKKAKYFRKEEILSTLEKMGFKVIYFRPVGFVRAGFLSKYKFRNVEKLERLCAKYVPLLARAFVIIAVAPSHQ